MSRPLHSLLAVFMIFGLGKPALPQSASTVSQSRTKGDRIISGVVVNQGTAAPIIDAEVSLSDSYGGPLRMNTRTDAEGRFVFEHLPDGKFAIQAAHRGFISAGYKEHEGFFTGIVTGEGQATTGLVLTLAPHAILSGTITDEAGDPVPQAQLTLYRQDDQIGRNRIIPSSSASTDDAGTYELANVSPGTYFVGVSATPWYATHRQVPPGIRASQTRSPLDVAFATTYYGDVTDPDTATPIAIKAGDRVPINITMHAERAVHITLPFHAQNGATPFPQLRIKRFGADEMVQASVTYTQQEGGEQIGELTVAPGHYELQISGAGKGKSSSTIIDATADAADASQPVAPSALDPLADVSGIVAMAGGGSLPSGLQVGLVDPAGSIGGNNFTNVDNTGKFRLGGVAPGEYRLSVFSSQDAVGVMSVSVHSASSKGSLVKIGSSSATLAALIEVGRTNVTGFAKQDGRPYAGAMIVLIPADPDGHADAYRRDQTDSDGSFSLKQVLPGRYTLIAIDDGWSLEWARPIVMERYLAREVKVTVPADRKAIELTDAVEVQQK